MIVVRVACIVWELYEETLIFRPPCENLPQRSEGSDKDNRNWVAAVGSQPCGEHASVSLPNAGAGKASGVFGCSLFSLSLSLLAVPLLYPYCIKHKRHDTHGRTDTCTRVNHVTDIHKTCTLHTHMRHTDTVV